MLGSMLNMFRVPDLRKKILFVLFVIVLYRIGSFIPTPGVQIDELTKLGKAAEQGGALSLLNLFSGGALTNVAVFALGIMPYITASIIMQLLSVVIPKLEQWREEGETGQKKITQWTRYLTLILALIQSSGFAYLFSRGNLGGFGGGGQKLDIQILGANPPAWKYALVILTMTTGTVLIMWLAELISQRGVGNGMSILIFASVVSSLPATGVAVWAVGKPQFFVLLAMLLGMIVAIVFIESGERRIQVQFAKRIVGRKMTAGGSTYIPLKVNTGGVIPVIFASSILYIPSLIASALPAEGLGEKIQSFVNEYLSTATQPSYIILYFLLVIGFAYFYNMIQFDPARQADFLKKQGGFIPGIRPGSATADYFAKVLNRITLPGALYLAGIAVGPFILIAAWNIQQFQFGGTSLLITVGVALETMKQIDSQLMMRNYESFLSTSR